MDGSVIKGDLELNGIDAGIRKSSSMISRIYAEGYDTSLPGRDVVTDLKEHFASCGEVIHVHIPGFVTNVTRILNSFVLIYLRGEEEKALKLCGSYMGGRELLVEPYPFHAEHLDHLLAPTRPVDSRRARRMYVTGFDTSLPADHVKSALIQHFSKCGSVVSASVHKDQNKDYVLQRFASVTLRGHHAIEKAMQLGGCDDVPGLENVEVSKVLLPDPPPSHRARGGNFPNNPYKRMKIPKENNTTP